jgi:pyruvate dehydrogenase E1 component alpha subunit
MGPHTTSDDPTRYRGKEELADWAEKDPIARVGSLLANLGLLTDEVRDRVNAKADAVAAEMRAGCLALTPPEPLTVFDNVYTQPTSWLARQKSQYAAYLNQFDDAEQSGAQSQHAGGAA